MQMRPQSGRFFSGHRFATRRLLSPFDTSPLSSGFDPVSRTAKPISHAVETAASVFARASVFGICATLSVLLSAAPVCAEWARLDSHSDGWKTGADHVWRETPAPVALKPQANSLEQDQEIVGLLGDFIGGTVSGSHGYEAVNTAPHMALSTRLPRPLTMMTLQEIDAWIDRSSDEEKALGKYQITAKAFRSLRDRLSLPGELVFDTQTEDQFAQVLYLDAGLSDHLDGRLSLDQFMDHLVIIWPELPGPDGRSVYHTQTDHRATVTRDEFAEAMRSVFPKERVPTGWETTVFHLAPRPFPSGRIVPPHFLEGLGGIVSRAESPRDGYDAVIRPGRGKPFVSPPLPPTAMTLGQIHAWVDATPNQDHAIGKYQIIPKTFRSLQRRLRLPNSTPFHRPTQDKMARLLYEDTGLLDYLDGSITLSKFQDQLAVIWAGLPLRNGASVYQGYNGNKATISRAYFDARMCEIVVLGADDQS